MDVSNQSAILFSKKLIAWHIRENNRMMPWKGIKDPYKIWLSEIILQQTRVEQGLSYYNKFLNAYPNIQELTYAKESEVFKLWEGLGYYSRCRNLLKTAKIICENYQGQFPENYHELLALPGVGPYTAAAIASFAFEKPQAVVDGNVYRVLSRYFGIEEDIDVAEGKKRINSIAQKLIQYAPPSLFNQAIMDFGATVCKPALASCVICPFKKKCYSFQNNRVYEFPVRSKILKIKDRFFLYLLLFHKHQLAITERTRNDIWQNLWEPVCHEIDKSQLFNTGWLPDWINLNYPELAALIEDISEVSIQKLSHQKIHARFVRIQALKLPSKTKYRWAKMKDLNKYPFPKIVLEHFQKNEYF